MHLAMTHWGDGPRRALLLHGIGSNKEGWWRVGPALADLGFRVTAVDLRGHGASAKADRYLLSDFADDLREVGHEWDLLLGHSLGGAIAVELMSTVPDYAERLILEDPALFLPDSEISLPILLEEYNHPLDVPTQTRLNPTWHPEDVRIKTEALVQCSPEVFEAIVHENGGWNLLEATVALATPTLIIGAGIDPVTPPAIGEGLAAMSDHLDFVQIPNSSHSIHRDEFDALMSAISEWLGK